jgi:glycosyltransferase involved in cell wall biosynthesis
MFTVAVDAWNLADDRRGMGRYVRRILHDWESRGDLDLTLIARTAAEVRALAAEFGCRIAVRPPRAAGAVWYPWNALRFRVQAPRSVVTMHDAFAFTLPHRNPIARLREQTPIRRAVREADAIAVNSRWSAGEIARVFALDPSTLHVVHPVPDPFFHPVAVPERDPYVLVVAGPDERKNLPTLFDAFERARFGVPLSLVVAGTMRAEDEARLARASFRSMRAVPDDVELRELYAGARAVAVPSAQEGYGIMAVEAMACGAPVIAADAAALPEACEGAARLVPPFDADAWASSLCEVTGSEDVRNALRARSLERASRIDRAEPARLTLELLRAQPAPRSP